ncbi:hypothetical protein KAR48_19650 [bacterium]|nr:hypothetical protein [bacterium]
MTEHRKLAAVMFTDIAGYTALMSKDEQKALQILQKNKDIQKPLVKKYQGDFLKEIGDGTLLCFQSVVDALHCAIEIQQKVKDDPDLNLRIGIHLGEIVFKEGDIFGDGVNVASRIEQLAEAGGIYISGQVYRTIRNKPDIEAAFLGEKNLKNVEHPVKIYSLTGEGLPEHRATSFQDDTEKKPVKKSIHVLALVGVAAVLTLLMVIILFSKRRVNKLPASGNRVVVTVFENQTKNSELDYLGREAAEWITLGLHRTGLVPVVPVTMSHNPGEGASEMDYLKKAAMETGANLIVAGSYYIQGEQIRIHSKVIRAHEMSMDIVSVPEPVTGSLENPMEAFRKLGSGIKGAFAFIIGPEFDEYGQYLENPPAYESYKEYLRGLEYWEEFDLDIAMRHLTNAIQYDSTFYLPVIWKAGGFWQKGLDISADSLLTQLAKQETHLSVFEKHYYDFINGNLKGDNERALGAARQMANLAPGPWYQYILAWMALCMNRPIEALEVLQDLNPEKSWYAYWWVKSMAYHALGDHEQELIEARKGREQYPDHPYSYLNIVRALAALGHEGEIDACLESFTDLNQSMLTPGYVQYTAALNLRRSGFNSLSIKYIEQSLSWYSQFPPDQYWLGRARIFYFTGHLDSAESIFRERLRKYPDSITSMGYLGVIAARRNNREDAERFYSALYGIDRPYSRGNHLLWCAKISALLGDKQRTVRVMKTAFDQGLMFGVSLLIDIDFESMWDYAPWHELMKPNG